MGQELRVETGKVLQFVTSKTLKALLWFVNNHELHEAILGALSKYAQVYGVTLYAFVLQGNHYHLIGSFPNSNRSSFMRDFNSRITFLTKKYVRLFKGGRLWTWRYSEQDLPRNEDAQKYFCYCALQPVSAGLVKDRREYPGYNSFDDAAAGVKRVCKVVNWGDYANRKRYNKKLTVADCTEEFVLEFARLPGYEHLDAENYEKEMYAMVNAHQQAVVREKEQMGHAFPSPYFLHTVKPGSAPKRSKTSCPYQRQPRVLTGSDELRRQFYLEYKDLLRCYKEASQAFRKGDFGVQFPVGTYPPPLPCCT